MTQKRVGILAAGNFIVDHVKIVDEYPVQDQLALVRSHTRSNGGGPFNLLSDVSKLSPDLPLYAIGAIGDDPDGNWIIEECERQRIDTSGLRKDATAGTSWTDVITVSSTARRTFFHHEGANACLNLTDLQVSKSPARVFYLGYLNMLESLDKFDLNGRTFASYALEQVCAAGLITGADLVSRNQSDFRDIVASSAPFIDFLFLNELEAGWVLNQALDKSALNTEWLVHAACETLSLGVRQGVVVHFEFGAAYVGKDGSRFFQPAVNVPSSHILSTLGAGDAFAAGFLYAVHEKRNASDCMLLAVCAAASCLTHQTASGGVRKEAECLALAKEYGFHDLSWR